MVGVGEPDLVPAARAPSDALHGSDPGKGHLAEKGTAGWVVQAQLADRVPGPRDHHHGHVQLRAVEDDAVIQHSVGLLRNEFGPCPSGGVSRVEQADPSVRGFPVGADVDPSLPAELEAGLGVGLGAPLHDPQVRALGVHIGQVRQPQVIAGSAAGCHGDGQPPAIGAHADREVTAIRTALAEHADVGGGVHADAMPPDPLPVMRATTRIGLTDVVEPLTPGKPPDGG